jgi:hypothetical protein
LWLPQAAPVREARGIEHHKEASLAGGQSPATSRVLQF